MPTTDEKALVIPSGEGNLINKVRFKVTSHDSGGACSVFEAEQAPGERLLPHVHRYEDEIVYVIEGEVEFMIGDQTYRALPGTTVYLPKLIPHGFRIVGTKKAKTLWIVIPGGFEKMAEEMSSLPSDARLDVEKMLEIGRRYGVEFLPPKVK